MKASRILDGLASDIAEISSSSFATYMYMYMHIHTYIHTCMHTCIFVLIACAETFAGAENARSQRLGFKPPYSQTSSTLNPQTREPLTPKKLYSKPQFLLLNVIVVVVVVVDVVVIVAVVVAVAVVFDVVVVGADMT